jgi:hypothetical protein
MEILFLESLISSICFITSSRGQLINTHVLYAAYEEEKRLRMDFEAKYKAELALHLDWQKLKDENVTCIRGIEYRTI